MSFACGNCPIDERDCYKEGCITAGGNIRPVIVVNEMLPGPSIQVCEGDTVKIKVINALSSESTTIHWHGMHQHETPFMDGTPYITQCPISPHNTFVYEFKANPAGSHMWHSHIGFEESDGLFGGLIIRKANDSISDYYDYDLAEHTVIIWHWYPSNTGSILPKALHKRTFVSGFGLLINGFGAHETFEENDQIYHTPRATFHVDQHKRYRFRILQNSAIYCPVQVSVDNHKLLVIASETGILEPIKVDTLVINSGERYDFILIADQKPDNYWMRFRGLGFCNSKAANVSETAILHYNDVDLKAPKGGTDYWDGARSGLLLNPVQMWQNFFPNNTLVELTKIKNASPPPSRISGKPDKKIYLNFSFNFYDAFRFPGPYPQINQLSFEFPPVPLLTQYKEVNKDMYCREDDDSAKTCISGFCTCPYLYTVSKDDLVEIIFIDSSPLHSQDHPMHLHGYNFYVVAMESIGKNISFETVKRWNEEESIVKNFDRPVVKDTIGIPSGGFTIIRFLASSPGYWLLHCHISNHAEMGMGVVLKVGEDSEMRHPPSSFPTCGNWQWDSLLG
ncbi:uncharacterized protein [Prorops nasuta]|uniref:uncharacterized protein n=1 Tax=Prorops nasuta TaxID=863751 RepID=UPI0034CFB717